MILYTITYLLSLLSLIIPKKETKFQKIAYYSIIALLTIIAGVKDKNTCDDTYNYIESFQSCSTISDIFNIDHYWFEPGYEILQTIIFTCGFSYTILFFIIALLTLSIYSYVFWKYSPNPLLSLFIFISIAFITQVVVIIRYGLATSIVLLAIMDYIQRKNMKRAVFFFALASLFHYCALTAPILLLFYYYKPQLKKTFIAVIIAFILSCFGITIIDLCLKLTVILPDYFQYAIGKGTQYIDNQDKNTYTQFFLLLPFVWLAVKMKIIPSFANQKNKDVNSYMYWLTFFVVLFLQVEFNQALELARIYQMYFSSIYVMIPYLIVVSKHKGSLHKLLCAYLFIYCISRFIRFSYFNSGSFINVI